MSLAKQRNAFDVPFGPRKRCVPNSSIPCSPPKRRDAKFQNRGVEMVGGSVGNRSKFSDAHA